MSNVLQRDKYKKAIQGWAPTDGDVIISGDYIPEETIMVTLGKDVDITINNVVITYLTGKTIVLVKGITYTFSGDVPVHIM